MSNKTFKVGDRVRYTGYGQVLEKDTSREIRPGDTGTVRYANSTHIQVKLDKNSACVVHASWRWERMDRTRRPQVGDRVRIIDGGFGKGGTGVVVEDDHSSMPFRVLVDEGYALGGHSLWQFAQDIQVITPSTAPENPSQKFIVSLYESGRYRPATEPKTYPSQVQATKVAEEMSKKHEGKTFVVLQALSTSHTAPAPTATTKTL